MISEHKLGPHSQVVEIASNDGYLLQFYVALGIRALGIDPAANVAERAHDRGVTTHVGFFDRQLATKLASEGTKADIIHANNVLAHVPKPRELIEGISLLLKPNGVAVIEVPYVRDLVEHVEFDTIYHEHYCYFSVTTLVRLLEQSCLRLTNVERIPMHGGSLRLFVRHIGHSSEPTVERILAEERTIGLSTLSYYEGFGAKAKQVAKDLKTLLKSLKLSGKRLAGYGASAKGTILLNFSGIDQSILDFVSDRSEMKQRCYIPGTRIPILPPSALLDTKPDYVLLLAWNFSEEIMAQQTEYIQQGGKFISPIPTPRML